MFKIYFNYHSDFVILESLVYLNRVLFLKGLHLYRVIVLGNLVAWDWCWGYSGLDKLLGWSYSFTREIYA